MHVHSRQLPRWLVSLVLASAALAASACGDDDGSATGGDEDATLAPDVVAPIDTWTPADTGQSGPDATPDVEDVGDDTYAPTPDADAGPPQVAPDAGADVTDTAGAPELPPASPDMARDLEHVDLAVDVGARTGRAILRVGGSTGTGLSFDAAGLTVSAVTLDGVALNYEHTLSSGQLDIGVPPTDGPAHVQIDYGFQTVPTGTFKGYMESGSTLLWPYWCGNLYPCHPHPADGFTLSLDVTGTPEGTVAIHPAAIDAEIPAYALAFAVGDYTYISLGQTTAGTEVGYWTLPETATDAADGTARLVDVFDWLEQTLGTYTLGSPVGPVAVDWGFQIGGIEHHPAWHVSTYAMEKEDVHAHEAVHGWFGTGTRLACWEDLVLSEGTSDYLAARAFEALGDEAFAQQLFDSYAWQLQQLIAFGQDHVAWPDSCGEIDVLAELFTKIPYFKGALFLREVAEEVGAEALDDALGVFYVAHANDAAGMQTLLDVIEAETGFDPSELAEAWLRGLGIPEPDGHE